MSYDYNEIMNTTSEDVLQEIEQFLIEENKHLNQPKIKLFLKNIIGLSDYEPGKYIIEAQNLMEKLFMTSNHVLLASLIEKEEEGLHAVKKPPITGFSEEISKFMRVSNNYSFVENKEIEILEKNVKFRLFCNENSTQILHIDLIEEERILHLSKIEKIKYLEKCLDYINNIKDKEIFKYQNILKTIGASINRIGEYRICLVHGNILTLEIIASYAIVLVIVNKYLELKSKLINEELNSMKFMEQKDELENTEFKVYDYMRELDENFSVLNQQLDSYDISEIRLKLIMLGFKELDEVIQKVKHLEDKYNCTLIDTNDYFKGIDVMALRSIYSYLIHN